MGTLEMEKQTLESLEHESEDESEISEMGEIENSYDRFDQSMQRLSFIENSFKTMSSSTLDMRSMTPEIQSVTMEQEDFIKDVDHDSSIRLDRIRSVLASEKSSEDKLKEIERIVNNEKQVEWDVNVNR